MIDLENTLNEISRHRNLIGQSEDHPGELTLLGMRLANLNVDLAFAIPQFHHLSTQAEIDTYLEARGGGEKVGDAQIKGRSAKLEHRKNYETAKAIAKSVDVLLARIRDRLEYLSEENRRVELKDGRVLKREFKPPASPEEPPIEKTNYNSPRKEVAVIKEPTLEEAKIDIASLAKEKRLNLGEMKIVLNFAIGKERVDTIEEANKVLTELMGYVKVDVANDTQGVL